MRVRAEAPGPTPEQADPIPAAVEPPPNVAAIEQTKPRRARKNQIYKQPERKKARELLDVIWPDRVPTPDELRNSALLRKVHNEWNRRKKGEIAPSDDTILRAAGRKG